MNFSSFEIEDDPFQIMEPTYRVDQKMLGWNLPKEQFERIPTHWLLYPEPHYILHYMVAILYIFLCCVALIGNGTVLFLFCTTKSLWTASNVLVMNLAVADFMMMAKAPIFIYNSFNLGFALDHDWCQAYAALGALSGIVQATSNLGIAYDRYRTISNPSATLEMSMAIIFIACTWLYALPWTLMPLFEIWGRFVPEGYLTSCTFDYLTKSAANKTFVMTIFVCAYLLPMLPIIYFYSRIVGKVLQLDKSHKEQALKMNVNALKSGDRAYEASEVRIAKTSVALCFLFVASWSPYAIVALIGAFGKQSLLTPHVSMVPALFCKLVACLDPYIHAISNPKFRHVLEKKMPWLGIKEPALLACTVMAPSTNS